MANRQECRRGVGAQVGVSGKKQVGRLARGSQGRISSQAEG